MSSRLCNIDLIAPTTAQLHEVAVPEFEHVRTGPNAGLKGRTMGYFMLGTAGMGVATGARDIVAQFLDSLNPALDVQASRIEVDLKPIPKGSRYLKRIIFVTNSPLCSLLINWFGKPVYIVHRTEEEIQAALSVDMSELRDPQADEQRRVINKPEWLIVVAACTHLGCTVLPRSGLYDGFFCPCHGAHFDTSGRSRSGTFSSFFWMDCLKLLTPLSF